MGRTPASQQPKASKQTKWRRGAKSKPPLERELLVDEVQMSAHSEEGSPIGCFGRWPAEPLFPWFSVPIVPVTVPTGPTRN